jgi:hypothetical protein
MAFTFELHYMPPIALTGRYNWPPLDDILAVGVPFPQTDKEKRDVDHC